MIRRWRSISLTLVASLVTPAIAVNSPPAIVVGTLIWRTVGGVHRRRDAARRRGSCRCHPTVADVIGEAKLHRLGAVGDRAAADGDDQVGLGGARLFGSRRSRPRAACAAASRRRCRRSALPSALRIFSISSVSRSSVPLTIRKARLAPSRSICSTTASRGGTSEHDLIHGAEYDTALVHVDVLPGRLVLLRGRLAEEFCRVMPEDGAIAMRRWRHAFAGTTSSLFSISTIKQPAPWLQ